MAHVSVGFTLPEGFVVGGVETWSVDLCRRLQPSHRRGVLLAHPAAHGSAALTPPDLPIVSCRADRWCEVSAENLAAYRSILPAVFIPNSRETFAACALLSGARAPAMRVLGMCHADEAIYHALLARYEAIVHRFIAVSDECGAVLRGLLPHRSADIVVKPYPITLPGAATRTAPAQGQPLRLLYAGRVEERQKRVSDLLRLAERLGALGVDYRLRIVGEGPAKKRLARQLRRLERSFGERVRLEPGVSHAEMARLFLDSDVCVLVSNYEGTSLVMLEALAHGCVPVVTAVSGTAAVIEQGANGYRVPVGDVAQMAAIVARLAADRDLLQRLSVRGPVGVRGFSEDEYLPWFEQLLNGVWQASPRAWPVGLPVFRSYEKVLARMATGIPGGMRLARFLLDKLRH